MSGEFTAVVTRVFDATVEAVYDAWTTPETLAQWITLGGRVERADVRVGGEFHIDMGNRKTGSTSPHTGRYLVLERPHVIEFTWVSAWTNGESIVRIELKPRGKQTEFSLAHTGLPDRGSADGHQAGWGEFAQLAVAAIRAR